MLHLAGVTLAIGTDEEWMPRSVIQEAAWAQKLSRGQVSRKEAVSWVSTNFDELFGLEDESVDDEDAEVDFVAFEVRSYFLPRLLQVHRELMRCSLPAARPVRVWLPRRRRLERLERQALSLDSLFLSLSRSTT